MASTPLDSKKRLALAIIDFLSTSLTDGTLTSEDKDSVEIAQSCIADTFHVDPSNKSHMKDAIGDKSLLQIYGVYEKLKGTSTASTSKEPQSSTPKDDASSKPSKPAATETTAESENFKSAGNAAMQRKDYPAAIDLYSKAINISPLNPIYLSNRAAAYSASHKHAQASTDAEMAVAADPTYTKAWSRLGLARYVLGDAKGSMEAYGKGIEYEGNGGSDAMKKGYKTAKDRFEKEEKAKPENADSDEEMGETTRSQGASQGAPGGMPDLSALAGMFGGGGQGGAGGGSGMPDLGSMMQNPMFQNMAKNLMSNPEALQGLMSNPQLRGLAERFGGGGGAGGSAAGSEGAGGQGSGQGGGGGGMPDLASLMNDPSIAEMAKNFMGGQGRGAGR